MDDVDKKGTWLEAMQNIRDKNLEEKEKASFNLSAPDTKSQNMAKGSLDQDVLKVNTPIGTDHIQESRTTVKGGGSPDLGRQDIQKMTSGDDFSKKMADIDMKANLKATMKDAVKRGDKDMIQKLMKVGKKFGRRGLKSIPLVGGLASALGGSEDASAAIPILGEAESIGMSPESEDVMLGEYMARRNYDNSPAHAARLAALEKLKKRK